MAAKTHSEKTSQSGGLPPVVKILIIVFIVLVVLGIIISAVMGMVLKKAGSALLNKAVESQTGIKTNIEDLEKGKMTFTDPKTGAKVEINSGEIPADFPKSFPLYPGAKLAATLSGNNKDDEGGYWLTFTTGDGFSKVADYFKTNLAAKGWTAQNVFEAGDNTTMSVKGNNMEGTVSVSRTGDSKETTIVVMLSEK